MTYRTLCSIGFILFAGAAMVHALGSANALPSGPNTSVGYNPVVATGGIISNASETTLTAPSDQMLVITDVLLSMNSSNCASVVTLGTSSGSTLSVSKLHSYQQQIEHSGYAQHRAALTNSQPSMVQHSFASGLPVLSADSLEITESGGCSVAYTISGYHAHP